MSQYPITSDGRRLSEAHEAARAAGGAGRWLAVRMSDGATTGDVYDTRPDAVRHGGDHHFPVKVNPGPMPAAEASGLIELHRRAAAQGVRWIDPDDCPTSPIMPTSGPLPVEAAPALFVPPPSLYVPSNRRERRSARRRGWVEP